MPIANITVSGVTPPAPGKKRAKITDTGGGIYQVDAAQMHNFAPGSSWSVVYKDDSFNGFAFKVIEKFNPAGSVNVAPGGTVPIPNPPYQHMAPPQAAKADPLPERIFVCGALNAALGNPNINPGGLTEDQVVGLVNNFRRAFARTFGGRRDDATAPVPNPQVNQDMSDEIPF